MFLIPALAVMALEPSVPAVQTAIARDDLEVVVCKTRAKTNTRFGTRTCRTRGEWAAIAEQNRREAEDMVGAMRQNPCSAEGLCDAIRGQ
jgi:hypothetical protein